MKNNNPWKTLGSSVIFKNQWMSLRQDDVVTPVGIQGTYTVFEASPFVIIVAVKDGHFVMVDQWRYPIERMVTEFPAGGIKQSETPLEAARRELKEETGYEAETWEDAGEFYELVSVSLQPGHLFIAHNLKGTSEHAMEEDGISRCRFVKPVDLEYMIEDGRIIDALTPAVFLKARLWIASHKYIGK